MCFSVDNNRNKISPLRKKYIPVLIKYNEECFAEESEEKEEVHAEDEEERGRAMSYDRAEHDWIAEQEMGMRIMEETENLWTPVKKFLYRHRKPRWGEWDGLHIEEEEF